MANSTTAAGRVEALLRFIDESPTPYHAARTAAARLEASGFIRLRLDERWESGVTRAFVPLGDGAIIAFDVGTGGAGRIRDGIRVLAAHTDSPALRVREQAVSWRKGCLCLPTEIYGGPIRSTWLDRELGVAGRISTRDGSVHLVRLEQNVIIPNLAIHLNRKVNDGFEYNPHDHLIALLAADPATSDAKSSDVKSSDVKGVNAKGIDVLRDLVAAAAGVEATMVAEYELLLHDATKGCFVGHDRSIYAGSRIDNLAGCFTNLEAFLTDGGTKPRMLVLYNHEEVGSVSGEGAQSGVVEAVLRRLINLAGGDAQDLDVALARSTVVSNDAAHALHPAFADKHDPNYAPILGGGPALKTSGGYRYATTTDGAAAFAAACERAEVPMQRASNRADMPSGSTVGPITWARTGMRTVDVGIPILAMHSIRECGGTRDIDLMIRALTAYLE
jgi:aspartyl aminopeptidase